MKDIRWGGVFVLFLLPVLSSACAGNAPAFPTGPSSTVAALNLSASQVAGMWVLTSIQTDKGGVQTVPGVGSYTLTFADNRVSTKADCNVCNGSVMFSGDTITIGPALACTRAACPTMAFESVYESILAGSSTAAIDAHTLTLVSDRGRATFVR